MATEKVQFVNDVHTAAQRLKELRDLCNKISQCWTANGYASGGSDELVAGDISASFGCSVSEVTDMVTLAQAFEDFMSNSSVATSDRQVNVARMLNAKL
jgi:hypothetical protein